MSEYCVTLPDWPLPIFHSPKAMVLLDPSVMLRRPIGGPATQNMPLGGPPARCGDATHSMLAPYDAK